MHKMQLRLKLLCLKELARAEQHASSIQWRRQACSLAVQAVHAFLKMGKLRPADPDIPKHLARLYHTLKEDDKAIQARFASALAMSELAICVLHLCMDRCLRLDSACSVHACVHQFCTAAHIARQQQRHDLCLLCATLASEGI